LRVLKIALRLESISKIRAKNRVNKGEIIKTILLPKDKQKPKTYIIKLPQNLVADFGSDRKINEMLTKYINSTKYKTKKQVEVKNSPT
jgi:hypothetical protein